MKHLCRTITLLTLSAALCLCAAFPAAATVYLDVKSSDWFAPAVSYVARKGLFSSTAPGIFAPHASMTRGMFYTVLARMGRISVNDQTSSGLPDVPTNLWYTGSVTWAVANSIAEPMPDGTFGANTPITRSELCLALSRYDAYRGSNSLTDASGLTFPDLAALSDEQRLAVAVCQTAGIVSGQGSGNFNPQNGATRAEVAQILQNFCLLPGQTPPPDTANSSRPWDTVTGWMGELAGDFPLARTGAVTAAQAIWLNQRILTENTPTRIAPQGTTLDGNVKHLTNYGAAGLYDCINTMTILWNKNNDLDVGAALGGRQEYYGYCLQTEGILRQDSWHATAELLSKDPWQCTWWVWGRAAQYLELAYDLDFKDYCNGKDNFGHGKDYYSQLSPYFLTNQTPAANSIVSWTAGSFGHVAYVEAVDANGIWVTMADSGHSWRGVTYIPKGDDPKNPYPLYWYPSEKCNGFNHLDYTAAGNPIA